MSICATKPFISEYNLDQLNQIHENFPIIYDADSSQHSALIDAVNGENLVIEGPPGSGKSQTITNLIAAAINNGKKVLFVAEKMAALNVVKDRLDKAGLGNFCLELHSYKSNKLKILQDLTQQYNLFNTYQKPKNIDVLIKNLDVYKNQLNDYVSEINRHWKETNLTVHEILSRATYYRNLLSLRPDQVEIKSLDVNNVTPEVLTHYFDHAKLLENAYHQIKSQCHNQQLESHFWYGVNKENLLDYEKVKIVEALAIWTEGLVHILNTFNGYIEKSQNTNEISLSFLERLTEKLKKLPP